MNGKDVAEWGGHYSDGFEDVSTQDGSSQGHHRALAGVCVPCVRNSGRFRGGLVFKAHILLYHSTLGSRVMKEKKKGLGRQGGSGRVCNPNPEP